MHERAYHPTYAGAWLTDSFKWGAHPWPLFWCDLNQLREIDCGAFASLFSYCLEISQVPHNRVQVIFEASHPERVEWLKRWRDASASTEWILDGYAYHESIVAHESDSTSVLIDTTDMVALGEQCEDPRYMPVFIRVTPEGWQPRLSVVYIAGRPLRVGLWESWGSE